jgi:hypothetical protein
MRVVFGLKAQPEANSVVQPLKSLHPPSLPTTAQHSHGPFPLAVRLLQCHWSVRRDRYLKQQLAGLDIIHVPELLQKKLTDQCGALDALADGFGNHSNRCNSFNISYCVHDNISRAVYF